SVLFFSDEAESGIRALHVTGVQTCALPIPRVARLQGLGGRRAAARGGERRGRATRVRSEWRPCRAQRTALRAHLGGTGGRRVDRERQSVMDGEWGSTRQLHRIKRKTTRYKQ